MASSSHEQFLPIHDETRPGFRLVDLFSDHIIYHTSHPPKARREEFDEWLREFRRDLAGIKLDSRSIYAFSDGSVHPDEDYHSTAAVRVYHRGEILHRHSFATGRATSFDAELAGLTSALHHSIKRAIARATTGTATHHIHLYADNAAALNSLFDTSLHSSQILSVMSCTRAKAWLSLSPHHRIHLHWVPGHQNIEENENVDSDATEAHATYPRSPHVSAAYARQHVTARLVDEWQQIPDLGHGFFPNAKLRKASHTRGGPLLSVVGIRQHHNSQNIASHP